MLEVLRGEEEASPYSSTRHFKKAVLRCYELISYGLIGDGGEYQFEESAIE
jgi:hypothetical protein